MKKQEMIREIQLAEAQAWKAYRDASVTLSKTGYSLEQIERLKNRWVALYDLREALGIPSLPVPQLFALNLVPVTQQVPGQILKYPEWHKLQQT